MTAEHTYCSFIQWRELVKEDQSTPVLPGLPTFILCCSTGAKSAHPPTTVNMTEMRLSNVVADAKGTCQVLSLFSLSLLSLAL